MKALRPGAITSILITVCAALTLVACATPKPTLRTHADPSLQSSSYRTYKFVEQPGTDRAGYSTLVTGYFKDAIRREMESRGYQYSEDDADLLVNFNANARESVELRSVPAPTYGYYGYRAGLYTVGPVYMGTDVETVRYRVGTANVDVVDARKKQLVWEGVAEGRLNDKIMQNPQPAISSVITDLFAQFPGKAGGSS